MISLIGTWMQMIAESWLIYRLTHSAVLLGVAGFASQIPCFFLATAGGVVADRYPLRRVLIITQICAMFLAFILAMITLSGIVQVWHVLLLGALLGVVNAFDMPARQAFVVELVGREDMVNAIGLNSSMFNGARVIGPAIAGALVAIVGEGWCFFANAISYIAVVTGLFLMKLSPKEVAHRVVSPLDHLLEGFRFAGKNRQIRGVLILLGVVSLMGMPYTNLMPIFADVVLKGGSRGLGILMGMSGGGALVGALALAVKREMTDLKRWIAFASIGAGISLIAFAESKSFWLSAVFLIPVGFFLMVQMASSNTLIQSTVPDRLRGRVMAVYLMTFLGFSPLGSLFGGMIAKSLGAPFTVAVGGAACVCAGLLFSSYLVKGAA
jgi:MFS family permease